MGLHQRAGHSGVCVTALLCLRIHTAGYCNHFKARSLLARHCQELTLSALYVVLTLAPVAFVLGVNCQGVIESRFVNRSFNIWKESSS